MCAHIAPSRRRHHEESYSCVPCESPRRLRGPFLIRRNQQRRGLLVEGGLRDRRLVGCSNPTGRPRGENFWRVYGGRLGEYNWRLSGRDASKDLVGNFLTISNIAGFNTLRMGELWFQQDLFPHGDKRLPGLSLRVGQMMADSEFVISDYGALFTNGTFGWPAFLYTNIPGGGPAYPMGTLGVRVAVNPWEWMTLQSAVFQGNVFAQDVNRHGFRWDLNADQGYFWINELQVRWNQGDDARALLGQAKFGAWFDTADFADPFFDEDGVPLADADSSGNPETHPWNYGFYWILDQMLYREPGEAVAAAGIGKDEKSVPSSKASAEPSKNASNQGLGWFGRIAFGPQNRNFVGFYFDTGLVYTGLIPTRDEDQVGVGFVYAQLTNGARRTLELEGSRGVGAEMVLEFSYKAILTPWLYIQPVPNSSSILEPPRICATPLS